MPDLCHDNGDRFSAFGWEKTLDRVAVDVAARTGWYGDYAPGGKTIKVVAMWDGEGYKYYAIPLGDHGKIPNPFESLLANKRSVSHEFHVCNGTDAVAIAARIRDGLSMAELSKPE